MALRLLHPSNILIEYVPLKQGLRQRSHLRNFLRHSLIEYVPLKQGLRLSLINLVLAGPSLIEYVPLKQGLRHKAHLNPSVLNILIEYVPLKQGLRRPLSNTIFFLSGSHRVCSIKTRIKTGCRILQQWREILLIEYVPLKQGLRRQFSQIATEGDKLIEYVPLKQGLRLPLEVFKDVSANS